MHLLQSDELASQTLPVSRQLLILLFAIGILEKFVSMYLNSPVHPTPPVLFCSNTPDCCVAWGHWCIALLPLQHVQRHPRHDPHWSGWERMRWHAVETCLKYIECGWMGFNEIKCDGADKGERYQSWHYILRTWLHNIFPCIVHNGPILKPNMWCGMACKLCRIAQCPQM